MPSAHYLSSLRKHLPLFSCFTPQTPFIDRVLPIFPNRVKFTTHTYVTTFDNIDPGIYFSIPNDDNPLSQDQLEVLNNSLLSGLQDYDLLGRVSLRECKPFAYKFKGLIRHHPQFNTFKVTQERLYVNSLHCFVGGESTLLIQDFPTFISHLLNFVIVGKHFGYESPFFAQVLKANVKAINDALEHTGPVLKPTYGKNKYSGAPTLKFESTNFNETFDLSDEDSINEFLLPIMFAFFTDQTDLTRFLCYREA